MTKLNINQLANELLHTEQTLINTLQEYVDNIAEELENLNPEGDVHHLVWDERCEYNELEDCKLVKTYTSNDMAVFHFEYHVPYEDYIEEFCIKVPVTWESLTPSEIAEQIILESNLILEEEREFEIHDLKRRLKYLEG